MTEDRSTGGLALPRDCPSTGDTPILTMCELGSLSNLTLPTQRCGAVGFLRVHAEENVNCVLLRPRRYPLGNGVMAFVVRADPNPTASFCLLCLL
jgi:hypothetical protein